MRHDPDGRVIERNAVEADEMGRQIVRTWQRIGPWVLEVLVDPDVHPDLAKRFMDGFRLGR